jgi:fumigallin biosynthesis monooxygenase-like protein
MARVLPERMCAQIDGDFVVFIIGMRVNKWWKVHKWLPVFAAMPRMLKELSQRPDSGFLGAQSLGLATLVQYWRSFEALEKYARDASSAHWPAWVDFNKRMGRSRGDVGIWHETYRVSAGQYEAIYSGMPPYGLGSVGHLVPARDRFESARGRIKPHDASAAV